VMQPSMLVDAFNPVSLNVAGIALCACAWITHVPPRPHSAGTEVQR